MAHSLIQHLQRGWNFLDSRMHEFLEILPAQQRKGDGWYHGTADALYQNLDLLRMEEPRFVLVLAGDHVYKMDYGIMLAEHVGTGADVTIASVDVPLELGVGLRRAARRRRRLAQRIHREAGAIPRRLPGNPDRALVSMGIYVFNAESLYRFLRDDAGSAGSTHDFAATCCPRCWPRSANPSASLRRQLREHGGRTTVLA